MTEINPPYVLEASQHPSEAFRRILKAIVPNEGVGGSVDLAVTALGTPAMSVQVAAGSAFVHGDNLPAQQGTYGVSNVGITTLAVGASDPTNPRRDLVVAEVLDAFYSGASNLWRLRVVPGAASASPVDPAVPVNAVVLARIAVAAGATTITSGTVTDLRPRAGVAGAIVTCTTATRPASPSVGQPIFETDTGLVKIWNGAAWVSIGPSVSLTSRNIPAASKTANSTAYSQIDATYGVTYTKRDASTKLQISLTAEAYVTNATGIVEVGVRIGGSLDIDVARHSFQNLATYYPITGHGEAASVAAGTFTIRPIWRVQNNATIATMDGGGLITLTVTETA